MYNYISRSQSLVDPCSYTDAIRQQFLINSDSSSYNPGQQLTFTLPSSDVLDLSEAYIDFDLSFINPVAEIPAEYSLGTFGATTGQFQMGFNGQYSIPLVANAATALEVENAINSIPSFRGKGYTVAVVGGPLPAAITITISNYDFWGATEQQEGGLTMLPNVHTGAIALTSVIAGVLSQPRMEKYLPIAKNITVQVASSEVVNLSNANVLQIIDYMSDTNISAAMKFNEIAFQRNGMGLQYGSFVARKMGLRLKDIDLLQKLIPASLIPNFSCKIFILLEDASRCLVQSIANQSYIISNPRLICHALKIAESEKAAIREAISSSDGLVIPFRTFGNFNQTILSGTTNQFILFNPSVSRLLGCYFVFQDNTYISTPSNTQKLSSFVRAGLNSFRIKIGSQYYPRDRIQASVAGVVEISRELCNFSEIVSNVSQSDDYGWAGNFVPKNATGGAGVNKLWVPWFEEEINLMAIQALSTSDIGYSQTHKLCDRIILNGVDTTALPNVQIELLDLNATLSLTCLVFYYSQQFLVFKDSMVSYIK